jgi:hypothetical protein
MQDPDPYIMNKDPATSRFILNAMIHFVDDL